ncbi:MAG: hypothetical protein NZ869_10815 [Thermoanaerobaculum sp.]|nr:hypothetical protein [Thermoanaerobaculum sp.]MDW7966698.1 carbonic anhydrase [Thermoanaerobaculum sp.]
MATTPLDPRLPPWLHQGFSAFCQRYVEGPDPAFRDAVRHGQKPRALVVTCSDSRVDPALLFNAKPGELFVVRNVAALIPPVDAEAEEHSVAAAVQFAVEHLAVPQLLVMGHSHCGGLQGFLRGLGPSSPSHLEQWLRWLSPLRDTFPLGQPSDEGEAGRAAVRLSLQRLASHPTVAERLRTGSLAVFGLYFQLQPAKLELVDAIP